MATDIAAIRAELPKKKASIEAMLAAIDRAQEEAIYAAALATWEAAEVEYKKKERRKTFIADLEAELAAVIKQIAMFNP